MTGKLLRRVSAGAGQGSDLWPVVLLLAAVLAPAVCLLWFMGAAMRNERFAVRQKLADIYRGQLSSSQARLDRYCQETADELQILARTAPAPLAFARCVESGRVDSVLLFNERGEVMYPNTPSGLKAELGEVGSKWTEASQLEYAHKDFTAAANLYEVLGTESTNANLAARAFQAEARCLVQAGRKDQAIRLVEQVLSHTRFQHAADPQGRLIVANTELMALELSTNRSSAAFQAIARSLRQRLMDYANPVLAAPQRRFLMKALKTLSPQNTDWPTLAAEELAARIYEKLPAGVPLPRPEDPAFHRASLPDIWQFATPDHRVLALLRSDTLLAGMQKIAVPDDLPADAQVTLLAPGIDGDAAFVSLPAGPRLPGWRLALSFKDQTLFDSRTEHQATAYLWTGLLAVAAMGILSLLALRVLRRQVALARLKNDLAAIVSHELKTPLSSMRVLVDTLLDAEKLNEQMVREYLELIACENERLSRVMQNFLAFSRMDRKKHTFEFMPLPARQIIDVAIAAMRERFEAPGCHFEAHVEPNLPKVMADPEALPTALINLLENAFKYSEDIKHIVLSARVEHGKVLVSITDNGIGIAARERKRIFQHFYQVDRRLSSKGSGCGLGLSIVQFIMTAHHGSVSVESHPGRGSTFTLALPAIPSALPLTKSAMVQ